MPRIRWSFVLLAIFIAANVRADEWPVPRGQSKEPLPYRYDARVLKTIPREFLDDATACVIYSGTTHLIGLDGTSDAISHEITRLNSRKGIDKFGEYRSIVYDPAYEKLTLNEARIIKVDGKIVPIEPKHVQLRDVATDFQVYQQDKQLVISFPNLEVGDAYEVKWTVRSKHPEFDGHFFTRYSFGDDHTPVLLDEFRVRVPRGKSLKHASINGDVDLVVTEVDGEKFYHWAVRNKHELPRDEDRPSKEELRLQVMVSTFPTWSAVGQWKQKLRADCWKCTPEVRRVVDEVTKDLKTPVDKAKALTYWVRRHVRYLSRGPGGLGYTPHQPHVVLGNRYGDCKDQAQLLAVMLKEIGLPVWLVTLGTTDDGQVHPDVPSPWGTHAILLTKIDGKDYWIDTTVSLAAWDFLPRTDRNRTTYITQDDELKLVKTPAFTYQDYRIEQITYVNVQPDGSSRCKRTSTYHHSSAWTKRDRWLEVPPGERRRTISNEIQDAYPKAKILALKFDEAEMRNFDKPVRVEVDFEIPKHFQGDKTFEGSLTDSPVWTWFLGYTLDPERKLAFELPTQYESIHKYVVQLPASFRLHDWPTSREVKSPWGFFKLEMPSEVDGRRFEMRMHFRLEKTRVEKSEFTEFQRFQDEVNRVYRAWTYVRPTTNIADAAELEKLLANRETSDPVSVRILAKLYLDTERIADARRVLEKGTQLFSDEKALWELRLQTAASIDDEEHLHRAMIKQFPGETNYVVALGATCLLRGDHAEAQKILTPLVKHSSAAIRGAAHYQLARSAFRQKNYDQALKHVQAALLADYSSLASIEALQFKAGVHEKLGQMKEAISTLQAALEADPGARDALEYLVRLEVQAGQRDAALDHLRRYTVAAGKDLSSLVKAADLHLRLGRVEEAFDLAQKARALGFQAKAQRILGLVHLIKQDHAQAAFHLERCDLDAPALAGLLQSHLRLGDLDAAERRLEMIGKLGEPGAELSALQREVTKLAQERDRLLAQWNPAKNKRAAVRRAINRSLCAERGIAQRWPSNQLEALVTTVNGEDIEYAPLLAMRGWLLLEKGQVRKALADAEAALKLQPGISRAYLVRGRARLEQGNVKAALGDLRKATELTRSEDAACLHWLAAALLESGQTKKAVETQRLAVLLQPNDTELQEQLRRMELIESKDSGGPRQQ